MKQDKLSEITKKAIELPLEFTHTLLENTKKVRKPSPRVDKIGAAIGVVVGGGLLLIGVVQLFTGRPLWTLGTLSIGAFTVASHFICYLIKQK